MKRHLALMGFMGAGKSTIGRKLAHRLGVKLYDIDDLVVERYGAVSKIFETQGEPQFRRYEYEAICAVLDDEPGVIALGGGAVTYDDSYDALKKRTHRIFVKVPPEQILGRLRRSHTVRPVLGPSPSLAKIKEIYTARMPRYAHADCVVEADNLTTAQVVERIVAWLGKKKIEL